MCPRVSYMKKDDIFASLNSLKKGVGSGVGSGSGSIRQSCGLDPLENVMDPQHCSVLVNATAYRYRYRI